jgi:hypothetical protein
MSKRFLDRFTIAGVVLMVAVFVVVALTAVAQGQVMASFPPDGGPASQPAVVIAPVAAAGAWAWFLANAGWLVPLAISLLSSVATGLSDYPNAGGVVRVLRVVVACLGVVQFRNAPGTLKAPLAPPAKA